MVDVFGANGVWSLLRDIIQINRSFLMRAYPTMKKNNPHTPIMLREAQGTEPRVFARFGMFVQLEERKKVEG